MLRLTRKPLVLGVRVFVRIILGTISMKNQILSERLDLNLVVEQNRVVVKNIVDGCSTIAEQIARFLA